MSDDGSRCIAALAGACVTGSNGSTARSGRDGSNDRDVSRADRRRSEHQRSLCRRCRRSNPAGPPLRTGRKLPLAITTSADLLEPFGPREATAHRCITCAPQSSNASALGAGWPGGGPLRRSRAAEPVGVGALARQVRLFEGPYSGPSCRTCPDRRAAQGTPRAARGKPSGPTTGYPASSVAQMGAVSYMRLLT